MTNNVVKLSDQHLTEIMKLARAGKFKWSTCPVDPKRAQAMDAYEGIYEVYRLLIVCANTTEYGLITEGTAICFSEILMIRLKPEQAKELYAVAQAHCNASQPIA